MLAKKKKGFTVLELIISIALLSVIVLLCATIVLSLTNTQRNEALNYTREKEIVGFEAALTEWIATYDNSDYDITVLNDKIEATNGNEIKSFYINENSLQTVTNNKITFSQIETVSFTLPCENLLKIAVGFEGSDFEFVVLQTIRAANVQKG